MIQPCWYATSHQIWAGIPEDVLEADLPREVALGPYRELFRTGRGQFREKYLSEQAGRGLHHQKEVHTAEVRNYF